MISKILALAVALVSNINASPNLPVDVRNNGLQFAQYAINVSNEYLLSMSSTTEPSKTISVGSPVAPDPVLPIISSSIQTMEQIQNQEAPVSKADIVVKPSYNGDTTYYFEVSVLDANGDAVKDSSVSLSVDSSELFTQETGNSTFGEKNYSTTFNYKPEGSTSPVVFTSGNLSKTVELDKTIPVIQ